MSDLITIEDYKLLEGVTTPQNDVKFAALITNVSQLVRTYCNNDFDTHTGSPGFTEEFNMKWASDVVQLSKFPTIEVLSVLEKPFPSSDYIALDSSEWYLDTLSDALFRTHATGEFRDWPTGPGAVRVTYRAGYQ